ncbi:hypothetical protein F4823DRAFT_293904 [Ustulina deusta]|nr:hypothetical protein F4823DRAFT_293904 [Ustulina deusta]
MFRWSLGMHDEDIWCREAIHPGSGRESWSGFLLLLLARISSAVGINTTRIKTLRFLESGCSHSNLTWLIMQSRYRACDLSSCCRTRAPWRLMSALLLVVKISGLRRQFACDRGRVTTVSRDQGANQWVNVRSAEKNSRVKKMDYDVMSCHSLWGATLGRTLGLRE